MNYSIETTTLGFGTKPDGIAVQIKFTSPHTLLLDLLYARRGFSIPIEGGPGTIKSLHFDNCNITGDKEEIIVRFAVLDKEVPPANRLDYITRVYEAVENVISANARELSTFEKLLKLFQPQFTDLTEKHNSLTEKHNSLCDALSDDIALIRGDPLRWRIAEGLDGFPPSLVSLNESLRKMDGRMTALETVEKARRQIARARLARPRWNIFCQLGFHSYRTAHKDAAGKIDPRATEYSGGICERCGKQYWLSNGPNFAEE